MMINVFSWKPISQYNFSDAPWVLGIHHSDMPEMPGIVKPIHAPYVCKYLPENEEYPEGWAEKDKYGYVNNDGVPPTHFMSLESFKAI